MNRYCLKISQNVPNAGSYRSELRIGYPQREEMVNDICICAAGSYDFVPLNRIILRQALLNDPEYTKQLLGIEVKDAYAPVQNPDAVPVQKKVERKGAKK